MSSNQANRNIPKEGCSFLCGHVEGQHADDPPIGIEPTADNNVMKVTRNCLFMRTASGSMYGGRRSMSWWASTDGVFTWLFFSLIQIGNYIYALPPEQANSGFCEFYFDHWYCPFGMALACILGCFWMFIPWRRQLPIIFNRSTSKVICYLDGQIVTEDWNALDAYIKDVTTAAVGGVPVNEGILTLAFHRWGFNGKRLHAVIMGTQDVHPAMVNRGICGAAMVWEYIRLYMREGAAVSPIAPIADYRLKRLSDPFRDFNLLKWLDVKFWWRSPVLFSSHCHSPLSYHWGPVVLRARPHSAIPQVAAGAN